jgi:hypothetical protein
MDMRKSLRDKDPSQEVFGLDEALARTITQLAEPTEDKIKTMSDLTPKEIFFMARLFMISSEYNLSGIDAWCRDFLRLRVSRFRIGRKEMFVLGSGIGSSEKQKKANISDLFAGLK